MPGHGRRVISALSLAALVVILGSSGAEAGIVVTDTTIMPTGDPLSEYDFKLALQPSTSVIFGDYITFQSIPDFDATTLPKYVYMVGSTDFSGYFSVGTTTNMDGTTNVMLTFNQPNPVAFVNPSTTSNLSIGDLFVQTTVDFPPPADSPILGPIHYVAQSHTIDESTIVDNSGTTTPTVVPEPASLALTLLGAGIAWPWLGRPVRRRTAARG